MFYRFLKFIKSSFQIGFAVVTKKWSFKVTPFSLSFQPLCAMLILAPEFKAYVIVGWWDMRMSGNFGNAVAPEHRLIWGTLNPCHFSLGLEVGGR